MDVMLDLETMGNGPNAAIVAIGAVEFDPTTRSLGRRFYQVADLETSVRGGGEIDASTVMWWLRQSDEARNGICGEGQPLQQVLVAFGTWLAGLAEDVKVWGNGAAFDNVILAQAYRRADLTAPWPHWNDRCYRTMKAMRPDVKMERVGVHHNALSDAESQALHLMAILAANDQASGARSVQLDVSVGRGKD